MKKETLGHTKKNPSPRVINIRRCNSDMSNIPRFDKLLGFFDNIILKSISQTYRKESQKYLLIFITIYLNNIS